MQNKSSLKVICFGAGYVGGPTMTVMALKCPEHTFTVVDVNAQQIERWNSRNYPFYEIGLAEIFEACHNINLFFTTNIDQALENVDVIFISVNTPTKQYGLGSKAAMDITFVENCIRKIAKFHENFQMKKTVTIVEKSTVPVHTSLFMTQILSDTQSQFPSNKSKFHVISNPEFLSEGNAIKDLLSPDRVIIGGDKDQTESVEKIKSIYLHWIPKDKLITTNIFSSELSKIVANSFLAQRISSINSLTSICEKIGANIDEIKECIGSDTRIGSKYLNTSIGFGGSCLGKDLLSLVYLAETLNLQEVAEYWRQVYLINEYQKIRFSQIIVKQQHVKYIISQIKAMFNNLNNKTLSIFGVAFKANTNDTRESPAISIIEQFINEGAFLKIYDPQVNLEEFSKELVYRSIIKEDSQDRIIQCKTPNQCIQDSHAIVILTEWEEFKHYNYDSFISQMCRPAYLFDGRNILDPEIMRSIGFIYHCLGK